MVPLWLRPRQQTGIFPHFCPKFKAGEGIGRHFLSDHGLMGCYQMF
jgi:hypothetical protein